VFKNLESHVKQRVRELLARHSALKIQPVEPYGNPYNADMLVAEKPAPQVGTGVPVCSRVYRITRARPLFE
jgi:hypothetical protein